MPNWKIQFSALEEKIKRFLKKRFNSRIRKKIFEIRLKREMGKPTANDIELFIF